MSCCLKSSYRTQNGCRLSAFHDLFLSPSQSFDAERDGVRVDAVMRSGHRAIKDWRFDADEVILVPDKRNIAKILLPSLWVLSLALSSCGNKPREGCEPENDPFENGNNITLTEPLLTATPQDPATVEAVWLSGPHAETYVIAEDMTNISCAQCHSPLNWNPSSGEVTVSWTDGQTGMVHPSPLIGEVDWQNIGCVVCHRGEKDQIQGEIAWFDPISMDEYADVESSTALCQKCHRAGEIDGHHSISLEGSHSELLCTDCHDPHNTSATCSSAGCHEPFAAECESIKTHDKPHSQVTCSACHDGEEPQIEWNEELQAWDTFRSGSIGIPMEHEPYTSHNIVRDVDCDRCHAPGDHPWDP